jgi:hypothetical protein
MAWRLIPKTGGNFNGKQIYSCNDLQIGDGIQFHNLANQPLESIITQIRPEGQICWIDTEAGFPIRTGMIDNAYRWETESMDIDSGGSRRKKSVRRRKGTRKGTKRRRGTKRGTKGR